RRQSDGQPLRRRCLPETVVEAAEARCRARELLHLQGAGEMDSVEPPQRAALGEVCGSLRDLRGKLDHHETSEVAIEGGDSASRPLFTSVRTPASASSAARAGTMTATGRFRSVTVIASPRRTRARVALKLFLSSRTPICVFAMTSSSGRKVATSYVNVATSE